jgi:hypothetical protein
VFIYLKNLSLFSRSLSWQPQYDTCLTLSVPRWYQYPAASNASCPNVVPVGLPSRFSYACLKKKYWVYWLQVCVITLLHAYNSSDRSRVTRACKVNILECREWKIAP